MPSAKTGWGNVVLVQVVDAKYLAVLLVFIVAHYVVTEKVL